MTQGNPMLQGDALRKAGRPQEALQMFDDCARFMPPNTFDAAVVHTLRGCCLQDMRRWAEAELAFRQAIAAHDAYAVAWSNLGNTLDELNRLDEAVAAYDRATSLAPEDASSWSDRGYVLKKMGRLDDAVASYDRCLALDPNHLFAWTNRGNVFLAQANLSEAIASYDKAIALRADFPAAVQGRAEAQRRLAGGEASPVSMDEITRLINQGDAHMVTGSSTDALRCYVAALEIDRTRLEALLGLTAVYKKLEQWTKALEVEDVLVELDPSRPQLWSNQGNTLLMLDRPADALESYDQAVGIDAGEKTVWFNRGVSLEMLGRPDGALESFRRALRIDPQYAKAQVRVAQLEAAASTTTAPAAPPPPAPKKGFFGRLASMFGGAPEPAPTPPQPKLTPAQIEELLTRATQHFQRHEFEQVLALTAQVIEAAPDQMDAHLTLAFALFSMGRKDEAAREIRIAVTLDQQAAVTLVILLQGLAKAGAYADIVFLADAALERAPRHVALHTLRAVSLFALGQVEEARKGALHAQTLEPHNEGARAVLAACSEQGATAAELPSDERPARARDLMQEGEKHLEAGHLEEALKCMSEAGRLDPTDPGAPAGESLVLVALDRRAEALPIFDRVIALRPDWVDPLLQKADALEVLGRFDEALAEYDRALRLDSSHLAALHDRGHCLRQLGRLDEAVAMYAKVVSIDPNMSLSWFNMAELERQRGRNEAAMEAYRRVLACAPPDSPQRSHATEMLARLQAGEGTVDAIQTAFNRAREADRAGRHEEAAGLYDEVLALAPDAIHVLHNKGTCLESLGRYPEALACYDRALSLDPSLPPTQGQRGQCLFRMKRFEEALQAFDGLLTQPAAAGVAPIVRHQRGRALLALGRHAEALPDLDAARAAGNVSDDLQVEIGLCQQAAGRPDEADRTWRAASPLGGRRWLHEGLAARARGEEATAIEYLRRAEESFLRIQFNRRAPDPLEAADVILLWKTLGAPPVPHDASPFVRHILDGACTS